MPGAALQRQPRRAARAAGGPPPGALGRPLPQAELPLRAGRRAPELRQRPLRHPLGAGGAAGAVGRAAQPRPLRARDALAQAGDALGRGGVRPRVRPRHLHDRRGQRLQHGGDGEQGAQRLQREVRARPPRHRDRRRLRADRGGDRARVLPQLDRQPGDLPRLVPAHAQGGAHGAARPALQRRHGLARGAADRRRAAAPHRPVRGGQRPDGAPDPARVLHQDGQLLHGDGLREGRRGDPHVADAARAGRLPPRDGPLLRTPRRAGGHLRRLPRGDGRRQRPRPGAVRPLVQPGRHAGGPGPRRLRRGGGGVHAHARAGAPARARGRAAAHPGRGRAGR